MGKVGKIREYRERLDRTLALPELTNDDSLKTLIRNQLLQSSLSEDEVSSENIIQRKTSEVSNFLDMLRSASEHETSKSSQSSHNEWKLKDDNEEYRVMYRPGPHGTPLHTLLVEGYVDGPLDVCLCISWETTLYSKWWPQISFPPFKITSCKCLQKVRIGEHVTLLRVKVTWPLSAREAVLHYFLFEYLKDGLVVVLVNSISDSESIDKSTHGFTRDRIPEVQDVVRIGVVGGFAIQKVTSERSYFRTIATADLKLDFVPPSLLNFISRQLIGSGFRLYQKAVASVSDHDEDYSKVLKDPVYSGAHKVLVSNVESNEATEKKEIEIDTCLPIQADSTGETEESLADTKHQTQRIEDATESTQANKHISGMKTSGEIKEDENHESEESRQLKDENRHPQQEVQIDNSEIEILQDTVLALHKTDISEIEEEESEFSIDLENDGKITAQPSTGKIAPKSPMDYRSNIMLSPEVERALNTLEKAISLVREQGYSSLAKFSTVLVNDETPDQQKSVIKNSTFAESVSLDAEVSVKVSQKANVVERTSHESRNSTSNRDIRHSFTREVNHNKIAPASPEKYISVLKEGNQVLHSSENGITGLSIMDHLTLGDDKQIHIEVNSVQQNNLHEVKKSSKPKNHRLCCLGFSHWQSMH